ncbi:methyltransferase domain-containing protein [Colletotrichum cereale]|nr:methyltransferase domain-containing protein [Colletotrichum cereale]
MERLDDQSVAGENVASSSTSLRDFIFEYRLENGRTYHQYKDGAYFLPNDKRELERLDLEHTLWLLVNDDKLGMAPPCQKGAKFGRVLDVGTGTGIWALDFGDEHPGSETAMRVLAIDVSLTLPAYVPSNVRFEVDDAEDPWTYSPPFQYIQSRILSSGLSDWKEYLGKCFDNLEPGGWVELQEVDLCPTSDDGTLRPDSKLIKWCDLLQEASNKFGRPFFRIAPLKDVMVDVGFVDVSLTVTKWPSNAWPKDRRWKEEVGAFLVDVRKEIRDRNTHAYWPVYFITGRKPGKSTAV